MDQNNINYQIGIGQKVSALLNLKVDKSGKINTSWGSKTVQGLGASIIRIIEEENKYHSTNIMLDELKDDFDKGLFTIEEYKAGIKKLS